MAESTNSDIITCDISVTMNRRWMPYFLGMLKKIEHNGVIGHSSLVVFYADGDGDCRPKFKWPDDLPVPVEGFDKGRGMIFDAG